MLCCLDTEINSEHFPNVMFSSFLHAVSMVCFSPSEILLLAYLERFISYLYITALYSGDEAFSKFISRHTP